MHIVLQWGPNVLVLKWLDKELNTVLIDSKVDDEFYYQRKYVNNAAFYLNFGICWSRLWSVFNDIFSITNSGRTDIIGQIADNFIVVIDLFFSQLRLRFIPNDVEVSFLFLILMNFNLFDIFQTL